MRKIAGIVAAVALSSGCFYLHDIHTSGATPEPNARGWGWSHHFIAGLITLSGPVNAEAICPNGVAEVKDYVSFLNWILGLITSEIWTPSTWEVYCAVSGRAEDTTPKKITVTPSAKLISELQKRYPNLIADIELAKEDLGAVASNR